MGGYIVSRKGKGSYDFIRRVRLNFWGILIAGLNKTEKSLWTRGGLHGFFWLSGREGELRRWSFKCGVL